MPFWFCMSLRSLRSWLICQQFPHILDLHVIHTQILVFFSNLFLIFLTRMLVRPRYIFVLHHFPHMLFRTMFSYFEQQLFPHILDLSVSETKHLVFEEQYPQEAEFDWSPRLRLIGQAKCWDVSELPHSNQTKKLWKSTMGGQELWSEHVKCLWVSSSSRSLGSGNPNLKQSLHILGMITGLLYSLKFSTFVLETPNRSQTPILVIAF